MYDSKLNFYHENVKYENSTERSAPRQFSRNKGIRVFKRHLEGCCKAREALGTETTNRTVGIRFVVIVLG
jgi:hypothetical protein